MSDKPSPYDLSTGDKGWPALVKSHKKRLKKQAEKFRRTTPR